MRRALLALSLCSMMAGCNSDEDPDVFVAGSLSSNLTFSIYTAQNVVAIHVACDDGKMRLKDLKWRARGHATLANFRYGELPEGLADEHAAEPLPEGRACGVLVVIEDVHGKEHSGGVVFIPLRDGEPRQFCGTVKQCYHDMLMEVI